MQVVNQPKPTAIPESRIPVHRDIRVTPKSITTVNILPNGVVRSHEFWMEGSTLWQRLTNGTTIRHTVTTPLLRKLLNDNQ